MPWNLPGATESGGRGNGIFISYRRDDSSGHVIALMEPLCARFGAERIFKDTDSIPAGRDFVEEVKRQLASCAVMLTVIGREWLTVQHPRHPGRRLDDPDDLVRLEVSTALAMRDVLVIPVLVDGATMPAEDDLPVDLRALARRNNVELTNTRWKTDTERLFHVIDQGIAASAPSFWARVSAYSVPLLISVVVLLTGVLAVREGLGWLRSSADDASASSAVAAPAAPPPDVIKSPEAPKPTTSIGTVIETPPVTDGKSAGPTERKDPAKPAAGRGASRPPSGTTERAVTAPAPTPGGPRVDDDGDRPTGTAGPTVNNARRDETNDREAIRAALERFRQAYSAKNEPGVSAVYPGVRTDRMFRDIRDCARVSLEFGDARVSMLSESEAQVRVPATYGCSPTTAQRPMLSPQETDVYMFERRGGEWVIESRLTPVDSRKK